MTIAIDIRPLLDSYKSGVAVYSQELLKSLFKIDKQNQYILFYNSFQPVNPLEFFSNKAKNYLPQFNYPNVKFLSYKFPNKIFNASLKYFHYPKIDQLIGNVDLFFVPNFNFLALSSQVKKVITVHDLSFERWPEFYSFERKLWHRLINPKKILRDFDKIIAVSRNTKEDLEHLYGLNPDKMEVIYSGIKIDSPSETKLQEVRDKYNLAQNFILFLGTLEPRKNVEGIILAFRRLKRLLSSHFLPIWLVIAGPRGWLYQDIFELARKEGLEEGEGGVKFIGYLEEEDKSSLYRLARLFIYPSFYEGFGFPPLEAMASGTPVITSAISSLPEVVEEAALLVDPYNLKEIAWAMCQVLQDEKLRQDLVRKGYEQVKKFSWEKCARETLEVFKEVIEISSKLKMKNEKLKF